MRQTVSSLGAEEDVEEEEFEEVLVLPLVLVGVLLLEFEPELQAAMVSAAVAQAAMAVILCRTAGALLARASVGLYRRN
jgi:hypothetical protein